MELTLHKSSIRRIILRRVNYKYNELGLESPPALWGPERERVRYPWEANIHPDNNLKIGRRKSLIFSTDEMHYINLSDFDVLVSTKSKERKNEVWGV